MSEQKQNELTHIDPVVELTHSIESMKRIRDDAFREWKLRPQPETLTSICTLTEGINSTIWMLHTLTQEFASEDDDYPWDEEEETMVDVVRRQRDQTAALLEKERETAKAEIQRLEKELAEAKEKCAT